MITRIIILTVFFCIVHIPDPSNGSVFIDAQKSLIAREEALLKRTQHAVKDRIDQAFDSAHKAMMHVVQQMHYYITYPLRAGSNVIEQSRSMLSNATSSLSGLLPFFGNQPNVTETVEPSVIRIVDEASLGGRLQTMRDQISKASDVRVVFNTEQPDVLEEGPLIHIEHNDQDENLMTTEEN